MTIKKLKEICVDDHGCLTAADLAELSADLPDLEIGAKMGYGARFKASAADMKGAIERNIDEYAKDGLDQWVREVFIPCGQLDLIKNAFGWGETSQQMAQTALIV